MFERLLIAVGSHAQHLNKPDTALSVWVIFKDYRGAVNGSIVCNSGTSGSLAKVRVYWTQQVTDQAYLSGVYKRQHARQATVAFKVAA